MSYNYDRSGQKQVKAAMWEAMLNRKSKAIQSALAAGDWLGVRKSTQEMLETVAYFAQRAGDSSTASSLYRASSNL